MSGIDVFHCSDETAERSVDDPDPIALLVRVLGLDLGDRAFLRLLENRLHLFLGQRRRVRAASDKSRDLGRILHNMPGVVVHFHLDEDVAREELPLGFPLLPSLERQDLFGRNKDLGDPILQPQLGHRFQYAGLHLVLKAGIRMHHVPILG